MQCSKKESAHLARIPDIALLLGWAGVIPFAALVVVAVCGAPAYAGAGLAALVGYGAIILSFMGGVLWGLEMSQSRSQVGYAVSIVPALVAVSAMLSQATYGILLLLCGFAGLLAHDVKYSQAGSAPSWYPVLRWQLTGAVIALLSLALLFARQP